LATPEYVNPYVVAGGLAAEDMIDRDQERRILLAHAESAPADAVAPVGRELRR